MLCNVNIDNCTATCSPIGTGLPVTLATASACIGGSFATILAWRLFSIGLFCHCCIAGEVSTKKDITTDAPPKMKSNAQGECRMPNCWIWSCSGRPVVEDDILPGTYFFCDYYSLRTVVRRPQAIVAKQMQVAGEMWWLLRMSWWVAIASFEY